MAEILHAFLLALLRFVDADLASTVTWFYFAFGADHTDALLAALLALAGFIFAEVFGAVGHGLIVAYLSTLNC
jgi:hypothetical protein